MTKPKPTPAPQNKADDKVPETKVEEQKPEDQGNDSPALKRVDSCTTNTQSGCASGN